LAEQLEFTATESEFYIAGCFQALAEKCRF